MAMQFSIINSPFLPFSNTPSYLNTPVLYDYPGQLVWALAGNDNEIIIHDNQHCLKYNMIQANVHVNYTLNTSVNNMFM